MRGVAAAVLSLEAIVILLAVPVAVAVSDVQAAVALPVGGLLVLLCFAAAGGLGRGWGYPLGWAVQVAAVALGFVVTAMFFLGAIFALLWFLTLRLGRRIEPQQADPAPE